MISGLDAAPLGPLGPPWPPWPPWPPDGPSGGRGSQTRTEPRSSGPTASGEEVDAIATDTVPICPTSTTPPFAARNPRHREGLATEVPGLALVALERHCSLPSDSRRGAGRDAGRVARRPPRAPVTVASPHWFDVCQHRRMSNAKVLPLLEPADGQGVAPCCPPLTERPMTAEEAETAARMFKALGDPVRLRLFSAVASHEGGEACVCDISDVGVSQPTVSHHLKKLKEAGLLTSERRGTWVYYRVEPSVLAAMGKLLALPAAA